MVSRAYLSKLASGKYCMFLLPNPELEPEKMINYEFSYFLNVCGRENIVLHEIEPLYINGNIVLNGNGLTPL